LGFLHTGGAGSGDINACLPPKSSKVTQGSVKDRGGGQEDLCTWVTSMWQEKGWWGRSKAAGYSAVGMQRQEGLEGK